MAATNHTPGYQLNQWEEQDPVLREDFNADNLKIDEVLQTKTGLHLGSYMGTTPYGEEGTKHIELGFRAKFVFVWTAKIGNANVLDDMNETRAVAADGFPYGELLVIDDTGFTVASLFEPRTNIYCYPSMDREDTTYYFAAFH